MHPDEAIALFLRQAIALKQTQLHPIFVDYDAGCCHAFDLVASGG